MSNFIYALTSSVVVSLISFIGIISLLLNEKLLNKVHMMLVGLGAGALIGGAFLHMIPELHKQIDKKISVLSMFSFLIGILLMFLVKFIH